MSTVYRLKIWTFWPVLLPGIIFALHMLVFGAYIVDDAGISFAYSRNLANGYGLVPQPGTAPVEGYSNFTWVLLITPFIKLGLFNVVWTPKVLSLLLVLAAFALFTRALLLIPGVKPHLPAAALSLASLNTSFVLWTTAGLEGPLYLLLVCWLFYLCTCSFVSSLESISVRTASTAAVVAALAGMTRPDGVVFVTVFPLMLLLKWVWAKHSAVGQPSASFPRAALGGYTLAFSAIFGGFLSFRWSYYGDLLPNTYYAKVGIDYGALFSWPSVAASPLGKALQLAGSIAPTLEWLLVSFTGLASVYLLSTRRFRTEQLVLGIFSLVTGLIYLILPRDMMWGFRFATLFFPFSYAYLAAVVQALSRSIALPLPSKETRLAATTLVGLAFGWSLAIAVIGTSSYIRNPWAPLPVVVNTTTRIFNDYADELQMKDASVLAPDAGGMLLYSRLRFFDLGMLNDRVIAHTLTKDQKSFYNYVFATARPTFIQTHDNWTLYANLDADPRFRRDYIAIHEWQDALIKEQFGVVMYSGDYVRRDAVAGKENLVRQLQSQARGSH